MVKISAVEAEIERRNRIVGDMLSRSMDCYHAYLVMEQVDRGEIDHGMGYALMSRMTLSKDDLVVLLANQLDRFSNYPLHIQALVDAIKQGCDEATDLMNWCMLLQTGMGMLMQRITEQNNRLKQ